MEHRLTRLRETTPQFTSHVYPSFRTTAEWGTLEASAVLMAADREKLTVPAPPVVEGKTLRGEGWSVTIAEGWVIRPGPRAGDFQLVPELR